MNKKLYILMLLIFIGGIFLWDLQDRHSFTVDCKSKKVLTYFYSSGSMDSIQKKYTQNFENPLYSYPGEQVAKVVIIPNIPVLGRFSKYKLTKTQREHLLSFLNNPDNFTWKTTDMLRANADYILLLYNQKGKEIGKIWFCSQCHQLKIIPFSPNYKFGYLKSGSTKMLLEIIQNN